MRIQTLRLKIHLSWNRADLGIQLDRLYASLYRCRSTTDSAISDSGSSKIQNMHYEDLITEVSSHNDVQLLLQECCE